MATKRPLSRREFLQRGMVGLAGVGLLAACAPQAPASKPADAPKAEAPKPDAKPSEFGCAHV